MPQKENTDTRWGRCVCGHQAINTGLGWYHDHAHDPRPPIGHYVKLMAVTR